MRGRPGCPTGQKKNAVEATVSNPPFSTRKGWVPIRPLLRPSVRTGAPSPRGEGFGGRCVPFRLQHPPLPARPAGGRAVTGVGSWAAGQAEKKRGPPQGPPKLEKVGPGRKNLFLPGVLSSGVLPKKAGPPPGAGRATGRCAPRLRKSPAHPKGTQYRHPTPAGQGPHQTGTLFFAQFCATFLPPPCTPACNFGPGSPGGERRFCHAHPP